MKREEAKKEAEERAEWRKELTGKRTEQEQRAAKKRMLAHFKMAVTKKHTVGSIKLKKAKGGKTKRRPRRV